MFGLGEAQYYVTLALTIAALALEVFAFVHALKTRPDAFVAAGKRTKNFWLAVTGVAMLLGFVLWGVAIGAGAAAECQHLINDQAAFDACIQDSVMGRLGIN